MKKIICAALSMALVLGNVGFSLAAESVEKAASPESAAAALHEKGLFNGVGVDENGQPIYALEKTPTRSEAIAMLVRLLGKE